MEQYPIPDAEQWLEEEIKSSRFITLLDHCDSAERAKQVIHEVKIRYPGASHYCWAYLAGAPNNSVDMGSSDDGEPSGSAGRPMLASLQGAGIGEVIAVVVRYYGGTKLGVGGLVRAYTSGIKTLLSTLPTRLKQLKYPAGLTCSYAELADIEYLASCHGADIIEREFGQEVVLLMLLPRDGLSAFNVELATLTQGRLQLRFS